MHAAIHAAGQLALSTLFPPRCGACGEVAAEHGQLCAPCWNGLDFIRGEACDCCGLPFETPVAGMAMLCGGCMVKRPSFDRHRAPLRFNEQSKQLVHQLKYYDQPHMLPTLARWMAQTGLLEDADALLPVPLHWRRLLKRRFNQSAVLANELSRTAELPVLHGALVRRKHRPPQAGLSRKRRLANLRGVFAVPEAMRPLVAGRTIVVVDDVMTTGATLEMAARVLKRAGAAEVRAVTIARTTLD